MQDANEKDSVSDDQPWRTPLEELERTLQEVGRALGALRFELEASSRERERPALRVVEPDSGDAGIYVSEASAPEIEEPAAGFAGEESGEDARASEEPQLTEFQKVWERHKQDANASAGPASEPEAGNDADEKGSFDWSADAEPEADAEGEASQLAGYKEVWARLRESQASDESPKAGGPGNAPRARAGDATATGSNFERVWERLSQEREGRSQEGEEPASSPHRLENLPTEYRMTIEDKDGTPVDLVPLHRALMAFASADDISLVGYAKGTAIVGMRTEGELDLDRLASVIGTATTRQCEVIPQDQGKLFLRLSGEEEGSI